MLYELFISLRYLKAKRKQAFISLISLISIGGVSVGVAALIIVLAVMTAFKNDVRDKILGVMAHITIQKPGANIEDFQKIVAQIEDIDHIAGISPYVSGQLLINSEKNVSGIMLHGIDPDIGSAVAKLEKNLLEGHVNLLKDKYENLDSPTGPQRDGIILGWELARLLEVFPGDEITIIFPMGHVLPTGPVPKLKKMRVVGIFSSGFYDYDIGLAYISLTSAQKFFNMGTSISGLEIRLDNIDKTKAVAQTIVHRLNSVYHVQDWTEMNKSLFAAINLEKLAMFLILGLIVLVAAFNIISTLVMMVMEKHADIATLKSLGATSQSIMRIFIVEGSLIGIIGTVIGTILGITVCWAAETYKLIPLHGGSYYTDHLSFTVTVPDVAIVIGSALLICFAATIYPARQASKLDPVVVFRYE